MSKQHCNLCLGTNLLYPMYVAFNDEGGHNLVDHIDGRLPECADCSGECAVLDSVEDADRIVEIRAERATPGLQLIPAEIAYLKCFAACVHGQLVAIDQRTKLGEGGEIRFSRATGHFSIHLPPDLRDGQLLTGGEQ